MANSAAFNPQDKAVHGLQSAVTRLGQELVQSAALSFAVQQMKSQASLASINEAMHKLWDETIAVAAVARVLAARVQIPTEEAFLAGLLHAVGRLYILARSASDSPQIAQILQSSSLIAEWHPSIAQSILENWSGCRKALEIGGCRKALRKRLAGKTTSLETSKVRPTSPTC